MALAGLLCACGGGQGEREPSSIAAGYAEADITPPIGYPLGGFGAPGGLRLATGVHDPILTQVAVFENDTGQAFVIVTNDSAGYFYDFGDWGPGLADLRRSIADALRGEVQIEAEHVLVAASHTHSGPDLVGFWQEVHQGPPLQYLNQVIDQTTEAALEAASDLEPVELYWGHAELPGYSKRDGPCSDLVDNSVEVLEARGAGGSLVTLVNYANHPTTLKEDNTELTADFVWGLRQAMQKDTGAPAMFLQGYIAAVHHPADLPAGEGFEKAENLGSALADAALQAPRTAAESFTIEHAWTVVSCEIQGAYPLFAYHDLGLMKRYVFEEDDSFYVENMAVSWHRLGPAEFAVMPGEPTPEMGLSLKEKMSSPARFVIGLGDDSIGYLLDAEAIAKDESGQLEGYELEMGPGRPGGPAVLEAMDSLGWYAE